VLKKSFGDAPEERPGPRRQTHAIRQTLSGVRGRCEDVAYLLLPQAFVPFVPINSLETPLKKYLRCDFCCPSSFCYSKRRQWLLVKKIKRIPVFISKTFMKE